MDKGGSRCLVLITVSLGIICVLLLVFIILLNITITAERNLIKSYMNTAEELNQTINSLQNNITDLIQKKLELETELRKLFGQGNSRLFVSNELKSWSESRQYCRVHGADLVIINTEEKQQLVSSLVKEMVWIGLSDIQQEGNMKWVDNSPLKQGFWETNEPNDTGGNEDCIELNPAKKNLNNWNDISCSDERKGVCEV